MSTEVATIPKNSISEVRVALSEYRGKRLLDIRTFVEPNDGDGERIPTKAGISLRITSLDELIAALEAAREQAHKQGWTP